MRNWILSNIGKTKKTLYIYNQTVSDPEIIALLEEKARSGFDIRVCQAYRDEGDTDEKYP